MQAFVLTTILIFIILEKTKSSKGGRPKGSKTKGKDDSKPDPKKGKDDPKKGDPTPNVWRSSHKRKPIGKNNLIILSELSATYMYTGIVICYYFIICLYFCLIVLTDPGEPVEPLKKKLDKTGGHGGWGRRCGKPPAGTPAGRGSGQLVGQQPGNSHKLVTKSLEIAGVFTCVLVFVPTFDVPVMFTVDVILNVILECFTRKMNKLEIVTNVSTKDNMISSIFNFLCSVGV